MKIGNRDFDVNIDGYGGGYIMGILNVTPDSFSDGGRWNTVDRAVSHAADMIAEGADIIDVGGESTRPGYRKISDEEEIARITPVITAIRKKLDVPISVDTYKSRVAEAALDAGADMINDIWGFKYDNKMADIVAAYDAVCCLMHNRQKADYTDFINDVKTDLKESIELASMAGINKDKIILDPGVGFAKDLHQNLEITNNVDKLRELGYPLLLGTSRKSMIGLTLALPADERVEGTIATTVLGYLRGCSFFRVHDVRANRRALDMTIALISETADNVREQEYK